MLFKTFAKNRHTKESTFIESDYPTKSAFIKDLRQNGYMVNPLKVKPSELYDWILNNTDCESQEWQYINRIPQDNENVRDWIFEGLTKTKL